jgi:putative heme transporter
MRAGVATLAHVRPGWMAAGFAAEVVSMVGFGLLEKELLRAGVTLRAVLATAYRANAIAVAVPVVGSGLATRYAYREFRRLGAATEQVSVALTIAGVMSTLAFAVLAVTGAVLTGNPVAGLAAGAGGVLGAAVVTAILLAARFGRPRAVLTTAAVAVLRLVRWPDACARVSSLVERVSTLRLGYRTGVQAFGWALVNWTADVACLICALLAVGAPVPWRAILLIWTAGAAAAGLCPVPAGLGVVDVVLITALAGAGLPSALAVGAVLLYRIITFKILVTLVWLIFQRIVSAQPGAGPEPA